MSHDFSHFLFTNFNIRLSQDHNNKVAYRRSLRRYLDLKWLYQRIEYFEAYCLPSVLGQTTDNFTWIILAHPDTPRLIKEKLHSYRNKNIEVIYTNLHDYEFVPGFLKERVDTEFVIQTQLDSDDAIYQDYLKAIQLNFDPKPMFLNARHGAKLFDSKLYRFITKSQCNPFRSFIEKSDNIKSLFCVSHGESLRIAPVREICREKLQWIQVIHPEHGVLGNLANKARSLKYPYLGRPLEEKNLKLFNIEKKDVIRLNAK